MAPFIPESCRTAVLRQHHDLQDIEKYCRECTICQCTKPPAPTYAPLTTVPIGKPWEMVAVDVLQLSSCFTTQ